MIHQLHDCTVAYKYTVPTRWDSGAERGYREATRKLDGDWETGRRGYSWWSPAQVRPRTDFDTSENDLYSLNLLSSTIPLH